MHRVRWNDWVRALLFLVVTIVVMEVGIHWHHRERSSYLEVIVYPLVALLIFAGTLAIRWLAMNFGKVVTARSGIAAGAIVRLVASGVGYVMLLFAVFAVFGLSVQRLLIGAGLAGIFVGIAAQQSLANIFASLVLLFARPFHVGDDIIIRSGALGMVEGQVRGIGLTYVTVRTADSTLKVPNSVMLASGIGRHATPLVPKEGEQK
jgi:small-conductance mechanosensitive channel